jgi:hypothetical protein
MSNDNNDFWSRYHDAAKEAPKFFIDVLAIWFDRTVEKYDDGKSWNFLSNCRQNHSHSGLHLLGQVINNEREYYVKQMLPRVVATVLKTESHRGSEVLNRTWPWLTNSVAPFNIFDAILLHLRYSLEWLSINNVALLRQCASTITAYPHQTFGYLLLRSWANNPKEFADESAMYLISDRNRLNIGYSSWSGDGEGNGECAISRIALKSISPYCSDELYQKLESVIIGYCDEFERHTPKQRGLAELLLLRSLDRARMSQKTQLRIEELERKFPNLTDAIVKEDASSLARIIGSPIPQKSAELMSDKQWISAMQKYNGSTDRFLGGPIELSRQLAEFARQDRNRFAALVTKIPKTVDPLYFSAILDGMSCHYTNIRNEEKEVEQQKLAATPTQVFLNVIDCLHSLPNKPCGSAIVNCISMLSDRQIPEQYLGIVSFYAINDPDPNTEMWQQSAGGSRYFGGNPYEHGINSVRGQAALAVSSLLFRDKNRLDGLRPALLALTEDPIISVRACTLTALLPLLNFERNTAVELFCKACNKCEIICGTSPFNNFIHYAIYTHYVQIRQLLQFALNSADSLTVENAARQIILAELGDIDVGQDGIDIRTGNEIKRKAAVSVYARNLTHEVVGNRCALHLRAFFNDKDDTVRKEVAGSFWQMSGKRLMELKDFIAEFIESKSFENEPERVLHALKESNVELPEIICRAAERVLEFLGQEGTNIANKGALITLDISTLIVRQYEQTKSQDTKTQCLDLIDQMEKVGHYGIEEELNKIDR